MALLIEVARANCVKRLEFEDVVVDFFEATPSVTEQNIAALAKAGLAPSRDLDAVPKSAPSKAHRLNQDYDAWTAAQPGPIFEKEG